MRVIGGLASAAMHPGGNRLILDGQTQGRAPSACLVSGGVEVSTLVSQGCRPVGKPYVVTRAEGHFIFELGGQTALARLPGDGRRLPPTRSATSCAGARRSAASSTRPGSSSTGGTSWSGAWWEPTSAAAPIAVGDVVPVGRTVQFHVRDAASADEDLRPLLAEAKADAALLFTCNGRGQQLFGEADHDASTVSELLGPIPLAGCFCAGEVGPIGDQNFLHGFTASLALFRRAGSGSPPISLPDGVIAAPAG